MQIMILGANQVAKGLVESLSKEEHDLTVVGTEDLVLRDLAERFDIRTITGSLSYPMVQRNAGAEEADMVIAVSDNDEINMIACEVAHALFHIPTKIARIRTADYLERKELFGDNKIAIDVRISPEKMITDHISRLIEYPGADQVYDFAEGKVRMVLIKPYYGGVLIGKSLAEIHQHVDDIQVRVVAIFRQGKAVNLNEQTIIETGDELLFVCQREHIRTMMDNFGRLEGTHNRVMIAGGGNIGARLAESLEAKYQVKLIEQDQARADSIANDLSNTTVLCGDVSDIRLLSDENIENMDVFVSVTNDDEANIMSCMQAKRLGVRQAIALVKRPAYLDLIKSSEIDIAISPQQITVGSILAHVRQGDINKVYTLANSTAELLDITVHQDTKSAGVLGATIRGCRLPIGAEIAGIVRGGDTLILDRDTIIEAEDQLLIFVEDSKRITAIEKLFYVEESSTSESMESEYTNRK